MCRFWTDRIPGLSCTYAQSQKGNVSLLMVGIVFAVTLFVMATGMFGKTLILRESVGIAAEAGSLAASRTLQEVFVADISEEAYGKLDVLVQRIMEDPLYQKGQWEAAILLHTVPSDLRNALLNGKRGRAVPLAVLLSYKPFFSEQAIGRKLVQSFERHFDTRIIPEIRRYLKQVEGAEISEVNFPVYNKIQVVAKKQLQLELAGFLQEKRNLYVHGRGHALSIKILDEQQTHYDFSGATVFRKQFD